MSTLETILTRAMNDPEFAEQLFIDPDKALDTYQLSTQEMELFKNLTRAKFTALAPEERKSLAGLIQKFVGGDIEGEVTVLPISHDYHVK